MTKKILHLLILTLILGVTAPVKPQSIQPPVQRCINLGNTLEAPREGEWGFVITEEDMQTIAEAGFDGVRVPIRWSAYADEAAPYTIEPQFFERIDEVVGWALDADLHVIINIHHYDEIMRQPRDHIDRLKAIWRQIAERYQELPESVIFELLNEPNANLTVLLWNRYQLEVLDEIRAIDPDRTVMLGGVNWNSAGRLTDIDLPEDTSHLIGTFHNYDPFPFTHQGAEWVENSNSWLGQTWNGDAIDVRAMERIFDEVAEWRDEHGIPVILGEFGAYSRADMESRLRWTAEMVRQAEAHDIGWCYWEFAAGFGIYNRRTKQFNELYGALIAPAE